uniref:Uncharacterized protein n=1 Tax=Chenopodium quinoa TaxID=63459 RepID=A0A803N0D8_CHEQI
MHKPQDQHLEAVYRILRYLKKTPRRGSCLRNTVTWIFMPSLMQIGEEIGTVGNPHQDTLPWVYSGDCSSKQVYEEGTKEIALSVVSVTFNALM